MNWIFSEKMNLLEISSKMLSTKPAFIVGGGRSGSSLLFKVLQKHSAFQPKAINLSETSVFSFANRVYTLGNEPFQGRMQRYMMEDRECYARFIKSTGAIQRFQRVINAKRLVERFATQSRLLQRFWWYVNLNQLVFRNFFFHAQEARGCRRIVEKTPSHIQHISEIRRTFPESVLLYIHRHL